MIPQGKLISRHRARNGSASDAGDLFPRRQSPRRFSSLTGSTQNMRSCDFTMRRGVPSKLQVKKCGPPHCDRADTSCSSVFPAIRPIWIPNLPHSSNSSWPSLAHSGPDTARFRKARSAGSEMFSQNIKLPASQIAMLAQSQFSSVIVIWVSSCLYAYRSIVAHRKDNCHDKSFHDVVRYRSACSGTFMRTSAQQGSATVRSIFPSHG